ncbi:tetratricopeptide repeat protein [Pseudoxanthomonas dokdonensis]|uniref:Membrane protein n=1 Tax=Pseudoxanthomonas dokdonensis TaxID=344882 RepID=A0A0R0CCJ1_9GAMM|nr:tetratricopeptide repeat protein [Pseudoxanthomonas dokdonensis]KRG67373.1 membrane protein [Pseudoxanthomonas dokdonensis]
MPAMIRITTAMLVLLALCPAAASAATSAPEGDSLTAVMAGEFALQAGQLPEASDWYLQAARESQDAGLAERATRIALLANQDRQAGEALQLWHQRAPSSLAMRGAEATLALRQGKRRNARKVLAGLMSAPDPLGWRYALTALASGGKDPSLSARVLRDLVADDAIPAQLPAWLAFAGLAQQLDDPKLAEQMVATVVDRFPGEPRVALLHANQLRQAGKTGQARQILDGLQPQAQDNHALRLQLAQEYDRLDDPVEASEVLALGPQDTFIYGLRATLLAKAEDNEALTRLYDELRHDSTPPPTASDPLGAERAAAAADDANGGDDVDADAGPDAEDESERKLLLGRMAEYLKRPEEALDWYNQVEQGGHRFEARLRAANTLFELGRPEQAYNELRELQGDASADDEARIGAYLLEAELRDKQQDSDGELDVYARGLAAYPDEHSLLYARGLAWERRDRIDRAEADLRKILVSDPDNVAALNALGYTLADRTERYQEALELIDRARAASPEDAAIIDSYGWVLYRLGRNQDALVELRRAYTLQKDPEIAAHVAEVLWVLGRRDEARHYFEEARKLDPDNRSLKRALEKTGA